MPNKLCEQGGIALQTRPLEHGHTACTQLGHLNSCSRRFRDEVQSLDDNRHQRETAGGGRG